MINNRITRRNILRASIGAAISSLPFNSSRGGIVANDLFNLNQVDHNELALRLRQIALDKAVSLGCDYADIRFIYQKDMKVDTFVGFTRQESLSVSVRVIVNGYTGFCITPLWDEMAIIQAVELAYNQAKGNAIGPDRDLDISSYTTRGESGDWLMPVEIDPFEKNPYEFEDYLSGLTAFVLKFPKDLEGGQCNMKFMSRECWFGSTNGSEQFQRLYQTSGNLGWRIRYGSQAGFSLRTLPPSGMGYELFTGQDLYSQLRAGFDEALPLCDLSFQPVDIGRFNIILPGYAVGSLLGYTIGAAIELDRIVGVEANGSGTSYIQMPETELGAFRVGSSSLNVTYDRSEQGSVGTRRWDDEGVASRDGSLIEQGVIMRAFADREMRSYVDREDQLASGNYLCSDPTIIPAVRMSNMRMTPAPNGYSSVMECIRDTEHGLFFRSINVGLDFQMISGILTGEVYEIKEGRLISRINDAGCWFKSTELWNNMTSVGGDASVFRAGVAVRKGEPSSEEFSNVSAPCAVFSDATVIDLSRR